jgi:hypothetical protein
VTWVALKPVFTKGQLFAAFLALGSVVAARQVPQAPGAVAQAPPPAARLEAELAACRAEKARLRTRLEAVFSDFDAAPVPVSLEVLVALDGRIRDELRDRPSYRPCESDGTLIYDARWDRMGVRTGYWDDLIYSGQLLVEAHRRETPPHGLGVMPDITAAFAYEKEFPNGPFIRDVYLVIADFHKDLFMVLRDRRSDYKFDCFAPYIGPEPWPTQRNRAKQRALDYYRRALALAPGDEQVRARLDETTRDVVRAWSFCAD